MNSRRRLVTLETKAEKEHRVVTDERLRAVEQSRE